MYKDRLPLYEELESKRGSKLIAYVTGDRRGLETQMHPEVLDFFLHHLDTIGKAERISLYLYTRGGDTQAARSIVNLIRQFCDYLEVIVPAKAHSAGTLVCLGANAIMMTKQATLSPIDPAVNSPLNPQIPGAPANAKVPVSVEMINGFINLATTKLQITASSDLAALLTTLTQHIHPLVLGQAYRTTSQIRMLAGHLISNQISEKEKVDKILDFLCSESGSHDYTIYRNEARDDLGLNIEKPDDAQYELIKKIYDDIAHELRLAELYDPNLTLGAKDSDSYSFKRALVESIGGGSHFFVSQGVLTRRQVQVQPGIIQKGIEDERILEAWQLEYAQE